MLTTALSAELTTRSPQTKPRSIRAVPSAPINCTWQGNRVACNRRCSLCQVPMAWCWR